MTACREEGFQPWGNALFPADAAFQVALLVSFHPYGMFYSPFTKPKPSLPRKAI